MKIVHLNTNSDSGGAAIAAKRHCKAMVAAGIDAKLVSYRGSPDNNTILFPYEHIPFIQHMKDSISYRLSKNIVNQSLWNLESNNFDVTKCKEVKEADIIYIHWVSGYLGAKSIISLLSLGKPIVWYMHDMAPITGGCHYSFDCLEFKKKCVNCPELRCCKFMAKMQLKKHMQWQSYDNLVGVAPSQWLTDCIKESSVFKGHQAFCIPNVIDTSIFRPLNKKEVREKLHLPQNKKLVMFASMPANDRCKGSKFLVQILDFLAANTDYEFLVAGNSNPELFSSKTRSKIHSTGQISDESQMAEVYNAADVYLITSLAENFPNVIIECMACGIPAVGFATGGIKDQIQHKINGWIVPPKDVDGAIKGLSWVLDNLEYAALCQNARNYVENNCSFNRVLEIHTPVFSLISH